MIRALETACKQRPTATFVTSLLWLRNLPSGGFVPAVVWFLCLKPVHSKVISDFLALRQARALVARFELATKESLQICGRLLSTVPQPTPSHPNPLRPPLPCPFPQQGDLRFSGPQSGKSAVAELKAATEGSLQMSGRIRQPLRHQSPCT
ncbi:hypothetical protein PoB_001357500 [Plakobranchus ocellatus]|uniref:Uncharacterized protein n=1 Tax=Plakobranchus ocellatus TaxID=259542 RepID=A0AAV3YX78_9GAST|nr:hypothetical protein PoB_001357500 [Plakobranchus ocellatus]